MSRILNRWKTQSLEMSPEESLSQEPFVYNHSSDWPWFILLSVIHLVITLQNMSKSLFGSFSNTPSVSQLSTVFMSESSSRSSEPLSSQKDKTPPQRASTTLRHEGNCSTSVYNILSNTAIVVWRRYYLIFPPTRLVPQLYSTCNKNG